MAFCWHYFNANTTDSSKSFTDKISFADDTSDEVQAMASETMWDRLDKQLTAKSIAQSKQDSEAFRRALTKSRRNPTN